MSNLHPCLLPHIAFYQLAWLPQGCPFLSLQQYHPHLCTSLLFQTGTLSYSYQIIHWDRQKTEVLALLIHYSSIYASFQFDVTNLASCFFMSYTAIGFLQTLADFLAILTAILALESMSASSFEISPAFKSFVLETFFQPP